MSELAESLRVEGGTYFGWLSPELTKLYLPRFLDYWIDSSKWNQEFKVKYQQTLDDFKSGNSSVVITKEGYLLNGQIYSGLISKKLNQYLLTEEEVIHPTMINIPAVHCISTFLPNGNVVYSVCNHLKYLTLWIYPTNSPTKEWTEIQLVEGSQRTYTQYDEKSRIYFHCYKTGLFYQWSETGQLLNQWETPPFLASQKWCVIKEKVYVSRAGQILVWDLTTNQSIILDISEHISPTEPILALKSDFREHLICILSRGFYIFNATAKVNYYAFTAPIDLNSLILHPNGSIYFRYNTDTHFQVLQPE